MTATQPSRQHNSALVVVDATDANEWDTFVRSSSDASFCHLWGWRVLIEQTMGHRGRYLVARDASGRIVGALPLIRIKNRIFGDHLLSVPFMNYGGPIGSPDACSALAAAAIDIAKTEKVDSLLLRCRSAVVGEFPTSDAKITITMPLPATSDELWNKGFNAKFRNKIKRPQRDGMSTRFGVDQLDAFYDVWAENMRDLGTPVLPRAFFQEIIKSFPDMVVLGATYWNDRAVAGGFGFIWGTEFEMTWSSSLKETRAAKPNMLLYWDYMRELIDQRGVRKFNFGRSTPGTGTHEFKQSWGGVDEPLPWIQWPPNAGGSGESGTAKLASTVWRRMPLAMANAIGPTLARKLPWW